MALRRTFGMTAVLAVLTSLIAASSGQATPVVDVLFSDDFTDGDADGWSVMTGGSWSVIADEGEQVYQAAYNGPGGTTSLISATGDSSWSDYAVEMTLENNNEMNSIAVRGRFQDVDNTYGLNINTNNDTIAISRRVNGSGTVLDSATAPLEPGVPYRLRLELDGDQMTGYLDGEAVVSASDSTFTTGRIAVGGYSKGSFTVDDVVVSELDQAPSTDIVAEAVDGSDMTVDGSLSEGAWNHGGADLPYGLSKVVDGVWDNTVAYSTLWDFTYLYVGARVTDASLLNDSTGVWDDDSFEVYIDGNHDHGTVYGSSDNQYIKGYDDSALFAKDQVTAGVLHAVTAVAGGYEVELAVPWSNLGVTPFTDDVVGFDVGNNDDDSGGVRDGQAVAFGTADNHQDTSAFGDLLLTGTPPPPPLPEGDRFLTPNGAGAMDGTSWADAFPGDRPGGLQVGWDATGETGTLHVGSGTYTVPQTLTMSTGGISQTQTKRLVGEDTGGGLPVLRGPWSPTDQVARRLINVGVGVSFWEVRNLVVENYQHVIWAQGEHETVRIVNLDITDTQDGIYMWGLRRGTDGSNPEAASHDIAIDEVHVQNIIRSAIRFRNAVHHAWVMDSSVDAGGQANWDLFPDSGLNFPIGFRTADGSQVPDVAQAHDIVFQNTVARNSHNERAGGYWNGDGYTAERGAFNLTFLHSKSFDHTDGGFDDKSESPAYIDTVAFGSKRNYRIWSRVETPAQLIRAIGGYSFKRGGTGSSDGLWVGGGAAAGVEVYFSTFVNDMGTEVRMEGGNNGPPTVSIFDSILSGETAPLIRNPDGGTLTRVRTEEFVPGVQGTDPQFVNGGNADWEGGSNDFNSQTFGTSKGYHYPGPNDAPYTVQLSQPSVSLGSYQQASITAEVLDADGNPVPDPEKIVWYSEDSWTVRLLDSRGPTAVAEGFLGSEPTELVAVYKGAEARIPASTS